MAMVYFIWVAGMLLNIAGLIFHGIGMYAINAYNKPSSQTVILFHLSIAEINTLVWAVTYHTIKITLANLHSMNATTFEEDVIDLRRTGSYQYISMAYGKSVGIEIVLMMTILTLDRLVCISNPVKLF